MKQILILVGPILGSLLLASLFVSATTNLTSVPPPEENDGTGPTSQAPASPASAPPANTENSAVAPPATAPAPDESGASDPTVVVTPPAQSAADASNSAADSAAAVSGNGPATADTAPADRTPQDEGFPRPAQILGNASEGTNCRLEPWGEVVGGVVAGENVTAERWQADDQGEPWFYISSPQLPQSCWVHDSRIQLASTAIRPSSQGRTDDPSSRDDAGVNRQSASRAIAPTTDRATPDQPMPRQGQTVGDRSDGSNCRSEPWGDVIATLPGGESVTVGDRTTDTDGAAWFRIAPPQAPEGCWIHNSRLVGTAI